MRAGSLLLRFYVEKKGDQWQAFCLDFCLAAQADTFQEARRKIESMTAEYVYDALAGEDRDYAEQLLSRKAPLNQWFKYYKYRFLSKVVHAPANEIYRAFKEPMPLKPYLHGHV